jgi:hypothetical protein
LKMILSYEWKEKRKKGRFFGWINHETHNTTWACQQLPPERSEGRRGKKKSKDRRWKMEPRFLVKKRNWFVVSKKK